MKLQEEVGSAIVSRMDAQMVVTIELLTELSGQDVDYFRDKYTRRYDELAAEYRKVVL